MDTNQGYFTLGPVQTSNSSCTEPYTFSSRLEQLGLADDLDVELNVL